jgi:UDP:flavonoid glycosyltransferase YjiC (YdhE family)
MKIVMIALGKGLKKAGHDITVYTSASFEEFVTHRA